MISNKFYKLILLGSLFFFGLYANTTSAKTIHDVNVPETVQVQGEVLKLNGAGIREKFLLDIYVGALYLKEKSSAAQDILASKGTKQITMHLLQNLSEATCANNMLNGIEKNVTDAEFKQLQEGMNTFASFYDDAKKGSTITINFLPHGETELLMSGKKKGSVKDEALQQAILKVWLGDKPPTEEIKQAMLGED